MDRSQKHPIGRSEAAGSAEEALRRRFVEYFPKVFAYIYSRTMDEERSREVVIEAFARAFSRRTTGNDDDFAVVLFSVTRDLCSGVRSTSRATDAGLNDPEREVLALLFDGQLTRGQVGSLLTMPEESVVTTLVNGLRKLKTAAASGSETPLQQT
jgi:DNA-directed RNA polymerase specialized sigma24 family protein